MASRTRRSHRWPTFALWITVGLLAAVSPWWKATAQLVQESSKDDVEHRQKMAVANAQVQVLQAQLALKRAQMQREIHELEYQLQAKQAEIMKAEAEFRLKQAQRAEKAGVPESSVQPGSKDRSLAGRLPGNP